jgi:WD40 repeat protein
VLVVAPARAIGWDGDDFLIGGGPSFGNKIGVFDHDLSFKGLLVDGFLGVGGMDFDRDGNLVVVSGILRQVRVYRADGSLVGGFTRSDDLLGTGSNLKVAPNGSYVVATQNLSGGDGARMFTTDGAFVRQYDSGNVAGIAVVPGNKLWTNGSGVPGIKVFDLDTGAQLSTLTVDGLLRVSSMRANPTNSVLLATPTANRIIDANLDGSVRQNFFEPDGFSLSGAVTPGPGGDVWGRTLINGSCDGAPMELSWGLFQPRQLWDIPATWFGPA